MADTLKQQFRNPGTEWRGAPFWSWNDDLDPQELRWQVREMRRGGLGGFSCTTVLASSPPSWASAGWSALPPRWTRRGSSG